MKRLYAAVLLCFACMVPVWAAVDLNSATEAQLQQLPGIGPTRAKAIVEDRNQHGPFASVEDLGRVKGIGEKTIVELKPLVTVAPTSKSTPTSPQVMPEQGQSHFPWGLVVLVALVVIVGGWLLLRRRSGVALSSNAQAPDPVSPQPPPATKVPAARPAGAGVPASAAPVRNAEPPPPAPAGPKPAGQPGKAPISAGKGDEPPAPAGAKPKKP